IVVDDLSIKGGVESVVTSLANGFIKKGVKVNLICVKKCKPNFEIHKDINIIYLLDKWSKLRKYRVLIRFFREKLNTEDILYTNSVINTLLAILFAPKKTAKYACDHNQYNAVNRLWAFFRFLLYKRLEGVIVLTQHDLIKYRKINSNCKLFDNPVSSSFFYTDKKSSATVKKYILNIGRLEKQKGQDLLLAAWNLVNKKGYELWICGDGSQKQTLEQQTKLYGLTTSVKFLGNRDDIDILLRGAYCNVLSSRFEGKPVSLIESKVVGCPNISFNCKTGPAEIINHKYDGLLIDAGNIEALAKGIQLLIDNPIIRDEYAKNACMNNERYMLENICEEYLSFFNIKA
ncbi:glycosyltransferase family 4 protein, partial [Escherichia coli]|nr:glycosyltransferase family 4 protein [Escherichia coli]